MALSPKNIRYGQPLDIGVPELGLTIREAVREWKMRGTACRRIADRLHGILLLE